MSTNRPKTTNTMFRKHAFQNWTGSAGSVPPSPSFQYANGQQDLLISYSHGRKFRLGTSDVGGPFHAVKRKLVEGNFGPVHNRTVIGTAQGDSNAFGENYKGFYHAKFHTVTNGSFPVVPTVSNAELDTLGATAISRVLPTNPLVDLAVALGEFRSEGIPAISGAATLRAKVGRARAAGGDYLAYEFGWRPLVDEIQALYTSIFNSQELIDKYERESGKLLHRRYTFPDQFSSSTSTETGIWPEPSIKTGYWSGAGTRTTVTLDTRKTWFEGAFTYYLAPQGSVIRAEQLAAKRLGHRITPEVLWNLTPWSWAADWVTNIGDVIHNVSAFASDGLVMPYGYMMSERTITKQYFTSGATLKRQQTKVDCHQELTTISKQRRQATPYGFGLDPGTDFSNRQWAILGALGLARGPKNF